ncbi:hypothetical protein P5V47_05500 [Mycobacteroides abscessus subsp. massiliense]|uniref:hypothetical protein n=1 Tax=Mycobacteroides abscessus TaxID=36809 RepID=UPI00266B4F9B|nr:hypothetical protein [Mycobacteroides abscessus]MDO3298144.1 hypothetical protein [Mycobacteroides abscessus subsp. massiliense]
MRFITRWWLHALVLVAVLVSVFFLAFGLTAHWGSSQWGSYGQCVGSGLTFAAVVVALRESLRGQRARAVDHEVTRRRECMKAVADVWTGLAQMSLYFISFTDYLQNLPERFNPNLPRQDNVPADHPNEAIAFDIGLRVENFVVKWTEIVEPPLFIALSMLKHTPFDEPMKDINTGIRDIMETELPAVLNIQIQGRRPNIEPLDTKWKEVLRSREEHLNLARKHFNIDLPTVEAELRG